ncbi:dynein assembly factor 1, axonemal-like isoform X2 [Anneissia japonica]|nr:dynein assembly factor 1, axonemal-like isoform X2 [Anneissia japonica]
MPSIIEIDNEQNTKEVMIEDTSAIVPNKESLKETSIEKGKDEEEKKQAEERKQKDEDKYPRITEKALRDHCKANGLYRTPELNDVLYLHYKGYTRLEGLDKYTGLKTIYLECNGFKTIENLRNQKELRCLFLQQNLIAKLENLDDLQLLDTLNVSNNLITKVENIACLPVLNTLNISHNRLTNAEDVRHLEECNHLSILDLSHNRLNDPAIFDVLGNMKNLRVLNLMGNPIIKSTKNYRKTLILKLKSLTYLDDRPVFPKDRACTEAWAIGGREAEKAEREKWAEKDRAKIRASIDALSEVRKRAELLRKEREELAKERGDTGPKPIVAQEKFYPPDEDVQLTFDVSNPAEECIQTGDKPRQPVLITEIDEDVETIELQDEKINIDDLPDLEEVEVDMQESPVVQSPKPCFQPIIQILNEDEDLPPLRKLVIEEVNVDDVSEPKPEEVEETLFLRRQPVHDSSLMEIADEDSVVLDNLLIGQNEQQPLRKMMIEEVNCNDNFQAKTVGDNMVEQPMRRLMIEEIDEEESQPTNKLIIEEIGETEAQCNQHEQDDSQRNLEAKIWELVSSAGSTVDRSESDDV